MKGVEKWTNKKIKYRRYIKEYYDADTGEQLTEEQFKNYVKIKTEYSLKFPIPSPLANVCTVQSSEADILILIEPKQMHGLVS